MASVGNNYIARYFGKSTNYTEIENGLFKEYNVKKGLRNEDGTGVRIGLTRVSDVVGYQQKDKAVVPCKGDLLYRGYSVNDLVAGRTDNSGYEEVCFLLLFGYLPNKEELRNFKDVLHECYNLPNDFLESNLLRMPVKNLMNKLQSATLSLYNYDEDDPDDIDVYKTLLKGLNLIAKLPIIACYAYQAKEHTFNRKSLVIHYPKKEYSVAENILHLLRQDGTFTPREADLLDVMLMIHADHGGGNNSTFTNVVVGSTNTDLYSAVSASIGSLKGPRHGGANISVAHMMKAVIDEIGITEDKAKIHQIVGKILDKEFYDRSGLVYGFGHAVYTISDPRAELLRDLCKRLAKEQGREKEFLFYQTFEKEVKATVEARRGKPIPANVDYYSGFAYQLLGIPEDLYTPLFAIARTVGWVAHNIENKMYDGKIMRPATKYVGSTENYIPMEKR